MTRAMVLVLALAACSSSAPALDKASIGRLAFGTPSGWTKHDVSNQHRAMFEWRPEADENDRKESLIVIRADRPAMVKATTAQLEQTLREAQRGLNASFSEPAAFTTRQGFRGVRIEGDLATRGEGARYRRLHAVLVDGTALVNVVYTAREPDRARFDAVIDSFFVEGF